MSSEDARIDEGWAVRFEGGYRDAGMAGIVTAT